MNINILIILVLIIIIFCLIYNIYFKETFETINKTTKNESGIYMYNATYADSAFRQLNDIILDQGIIMNTNGHDGSNIYYNNNITDDTYTNFKKMAKNVRSIADLYLTSMDEIIFIIIIDKTKIISDELRNIILCNYLDAFDGTIPTNDIVSKWIKDNNINCSSVMAINNTIKNNTTTNNTIKNNTIKSNATVNNTTKLKVSAPNNNYLMFIIITVLISISITAYFMIIKQ